MEDGPSRAEDVTAAAEHHIRAARWYATGADGLHLFNENRPEVFRTVGTVGTKSSPPLAP